MLADPERTKSPADAALAPTERLARVRKSVDKCAVEAMVDSAGPPVGILVEPDMTHAVAAVMELERFVDAGHNYTKKTTPSVEAVVEKCQLLEELAVRQVKRVNVAHQSMAHESRRLDDLQSRFTEVCEVKIPRCVASLLMHHTQHFHVFALIVYLRTTT